MSCLTCSRGYYIVKIWSKNASWFFKIKLCLKILISLKKISDLCISVAQEREGVPVELLNLVDDCIEVPQHGLIREHCKINTFLSQRYPYKLCLIVIKYEWDIHVLCLNSDFFNLWFHYKTKLRISCLRNFQN